MIIAELIAELGFDLKNEGDLNRFNKGLDQTQQHVERFAKHISTMQIALGSFFGNIAANLAMRIGHAIGSIPGDILNVGKKFEAYGIQLKALEGSQEGANKALDWISDFAKRTPLDLEGVVDAYARLRMFGLDPTNGSLQSLVDNMAMTGGKAADLQGVILPLGQAWTAQKLQAQDANQLLQRGVPVWDLLSKAMGKSVAEIQALSKAGKLGRREIQLLIDEMGKRAKGASEAYSKTFEGITSNIGDIWTQFLKKISDSGFYDDITRRLKGVQDTLDAWDKDGTLSHWAESTGKAFGSVMGSVGRFSWGIWTLGEKVSEGLKKLTGGKLDLSTLQSLEALGALLLRRFMPLTFWITLAYLALDDFLGYLKGDDSVFGDFVAWIEKMTGASQGLAEAIGGIAVGLGLLAALKPGALLKALGKALGVGGAAGGAAKGAGTAASGGWLAAAAGWLGQAAPFLGALITPSSAPKDQNSYLNASPEERARMRAQARKDAAGYGGQHSDAAPPDRGAAYRAYLAGKNGGGDSMSNFMANWNKLDSGTAARATSSSFTDNRNQSVTVGDINVTVKEPTEAPAAIGALIKSEIQKSVPDYNRTSYARGNAEPMRTPARLITGN